MGWVTDARAGYKAQCNPSNGRVVVKLCDIVEVALKGLKVELLVDLVELGDEGRSSVKDEKEKVHGAIWRGFQRHWVRI